jgi:hypothetical protein
MELSVGPEYGSSLLEYLELNLDLWIFIFLFFKIGYIFWNKKANSIVKSLTSKPNFVSK